jgi:hypothetical protein
MELLLHSPYITFKDLQGSNAGRRGENSYDVLLKPKCLSPSLI